MIDVFQEIYEVSHAQVVQSFAYTSKLLLVRRDSTGSAGLIAGMGVVQLAAVKLEEEKAGQKVSRLMRVHKPIELDSGPYSELSQIFWW